jgi:hypothetical protein
MLYHFKPLLSISARSGLAGGMMRDEAAKNKKRNRDGPI